MSKKRSSDDLFCNFYAEWVKVYKEGAVRPITLSKYNMAHSWLMLASKLGFELRLACPKKYMPKQEILDIAYSNAKQSGAKIIITDDISATVKDSHVVTTDTWVSMGQEAEKDQRMQDFKDYRVDSKVMSLAHKKAIFLHL